ncbi:hypothetical protein GHT06_015568 [Daphnia sinensis]|uniref:Sulfotransferase domain-containing protein n=1 Tax=Daphnia sinensis TaxID=1820382 RepID=A0AAD5PW83_9CRUS|nr:hypothetical protein GHT06_015568 [Daphnia sinensis]
MVFFFCQTPPEILDKLLCVLASAVWGYLRHHKLKLQCKEVLSSFVQLETWRQKPASLGRRFRTTDRFRMRCGNKLLIAMLFILIVLFYRITITPLTFTNAAYSNSGNQNALKGQTGDSLDSDLSEGIRAVRMKQFVEGSKGLLLDQSVDISTRTSAVEFLPPISKILIVTTWRSGSSFLGEVISSLPDVFYSYEPMAYFETNNGSKTELIRSLFQCQFPAGYLSYINGVEVPRRKFMILNKRVWGACRHNRTLCNQPEFVGQQCSTSNIHLMKTVRLRVKELSPLLITDPAFTNWKIIYLVRDPRGVMSSRNNLQWCVRDPACNDAGRLCSEVNEDLEELNRLQNLFPNQLYLLKFEDLSANVETETKKLFQFLNMPFSRSVKDYLARHTQSNPPVHRPGETFRESKSVASAWKTKMSMDRIANITGVCIPTLKILGIL